MYYIQSRCIRKCPLVRNLIIDVTYSTKVSLCEDRKGEWENFLPSFQVLIDFWKHPFMFHDRWRKEERKLERKSGRDGEKKSPTKLEVAVWECCSFGFFLWFRTFPSRFARQQSLKCVYSIVTSEKRLEKGVHGKRPNFERRNTQRNGWYNAVTWRLTLFP